MDRAFKVGFVAGMATVAAKVVWDRPWQAEVPASSRLDAWVPGAQFRDTIVLPGVHASRDEVFRAFEAVTPSDMPWATLVGDLRYLPGRLAGKAASPPAPRPFMALLQEDAGNIVLERVPGEELVLGAIGRFHDPLDQEPVPLAGPEDFLAFDEAGYEKLAMSLRVLGEDPVAGLTLALEHRTLALDADARRRFSLYWLLIKPGGAFVTWQLLAATKRRAEAAVSI